VGIGPISTLSSSSSPSWCFSLGDPWVDKAVDDEANALPDPDDVDFDDDFDFSTDPL